MKKYRLKDLEFQRKLDGITSNTFTKSLLSGIDPADYCRVFEVVWVGTASGRGLARSTPTRKSSS